MQVSTTCRSTVKRWIAEACGSSRIRSHSGRIAASAPVSSSVSQVPSSPRPEASSRTSSRRASGRPRVGQRGALPGQPGRGRRGQDDVALGGLGRGAEQQGRVLGRPGVPVEHDLAGRPAPRPRRHRRQRGPACADVRGPGQRVVDPAPGQPGQVRDPAAELAHVHLGGPGVRDARAGGRARSTAPARSGRWPGRPVLHVVAHVEQGQPAALQLDVRYVDQPGRDQRLEHGRVADPALGLLEVGHRLVGQLAHQLVPLTDQLVQLGQPLAGVPPPVGEHRGPQPQGQVRVAGHVPHVEQAEWRPAGRRRRRRPSRAACAPSGRRLAPESHSGYQTCSATRRSWSASTGPSGSLTSTTSRSECGASSARP